MRNLIFRSIFSLVLLSATTLPAQVTLLLGVVPNVGAAGTTMSVVIKGIFLPDGLTVSQVNFGNDITVQNIERLPSETLDSNGETIVVESIRISIVISSSANIGTRPVRIGLSAISFPAVFTVIHENENPPPGAKTDFGAIQYAT
ncbi:hypothetical protein L0244_31790, partial [bacterium]|nr:hypothetical protein [bacterium]